MNLRRLEFTLTTKCNSRCIHCQADASPARGDVMDVEDARDCLAEATAASNIESFMIFGGEPMLYPERVIPIISKAHQLEIPRIEMITNGVWGKDRGTAEKLAVKLKAAGLNEVNVSVDAFHLPYIRLTYARNAASALLKAGVETVRWNVAVIESIDAQNEYDRGTNQMLRKLGSIGIEARIVKIVPVGRAVQNLSEFFLRSSVHGPCEGEPLTGNTLTDPESVCIEPSGSVDVCWHLSIGNVKQEPLSRIIATYDWRQTLVTKTLVEEGPAGLVRLPEAHGFKIQESLYINKCHLCTEVRKILKQPS
jgi:MoaA/NifB/PqqE/SkfB family radical SAM enzyme